MSRKRRGTGTPEALTIRRWVIPRLEAAGWTHRSWEREYPITNGQLSVVDGRVRTGRPLRADFALLYGEHPVAVVEAKESLRDVRAGVQQAREYATRLDLGVAYATNGDRIIEIDLRAETEREVPAFRSPHELWAHHRQAAGLHSDFGAEQYGEQLTVGQGFGAERGQPLTRSFSRW